MHSATVRYEASKAAKQAVIELRHVSKEFVKPSGEVHPVLQDINLRIYKGEFCSIVGPTGCGKSTALGLRLRGIKKTEAFAEARKWIERVGLSGFENHYPSQLSGGMKKRLALAQCLIVQPKILLMDESFSALDVHTRSLMESELLSIWEETRASVVFITHDLEEAISLSDRVIVLTAGPAASIKGDYHIDLPRPRNVSEIRFDSEFMRLHEQIWGDLRDEVMKSYAQQSNSH